MLCLSFPICNGDRVLWRFNELKHIKFIVWCRGESGGVLIFSFSSLLGPKGRGLSTHLPLPRVCHNPPGPSLQGYYHPNLIPPRPLTGKHGGTSSFSSS